MIANCLNLSQEILNVLNRSKHTPDEKLAALQLADKFFRHTWGEAIHAGSQAEADFSKGAAQIGDFISQFKASDSIA